MTTYTYRLRPGHSSLDHVAAEIIIRAQRAASGVRTKRALCSALRIAIGEMRALMGPRAWPAIDIVADAR